MSSNVNQVLASGQHYQVGLKLCTQYPTYGRAESAAALIEVIAATSQRGPKLPLEVVYVIDISGSMAANMPVLNAALQFLCQSTPEHHAISIVVFNSEASLYWPMTKMTSAAKQQLRSKQPLKAEGFTNLAVGLYQGMNQFSASASDPESKAVDPTQRFVVLLSDGIPTHGPKSCDDIMTVLQRHPQFTNIQIITMAIGSETDRDLLSHLALKSQGKMYFVQQLDQLPCALGDCLGSFMTVVASRLSVEIEAEEVINRNVVRQVEEVSDATSCMRSRSTLASQQVDGRRLAFQLGTLYFGEQRSLLVDIPAPYTGFVARIRYLDASTGEPVTLERRLNIPRVNDVPAGPRPEAADVAVQLLRTEGQQIITRSAETQDATELEALQKKIVEGPYVDHPVGKCLLADIRRLLELHAAATRATEALGLGHLDPMRRQTTCQDYSMACASAGVTMATQQSIAVQVDEKESEEEDEETGDDGLDMMSLRRAMSAKCSQHTQRATKNK